MAGGFSAVLYRIQRKFCAHWRGGLDERTKTSGKNCEKCSFLFKKTRKDRRFWTKSERAREKGAVRDADRALSGNVREKTIFQVEKNHFS